MGGGGGGGLLVLFCIPRGSMSTLGLCCGPALHTPVGEFLASFIVLIVFILSIVLSFILVLSLQGTSFMGTMTDK